MFTILTGSQFGDEGKGKIVDLLAENYDIVVRFQGGDNAGHTVIVGDKTYKLHLTPSGVLFGARLLIGPGVVLNPKVLMSEIESLEAEGIEANLGIDAKTSIIMPYHIALDELRERGRKEKIGTTKRGIGYAYIDKFSRDEVQMKDLTDPALLEAKLDEIGPAREKAIADLGGDPSVVRDPVLIGEYLEIGRRLASRVADVSYEINVALDAGKKVLAEGAQGAFLDVIHGTQKFVTSSFTTAGSACANLGVGPARVDSVVGIVKAYMTRVGEGPMPTELKDEVGAHLSKVGKEFGTTTGRPRRCGWFDAVLAKKSMYLNGYTEIAITKLDVLGGLDPIKICTGYELDGEVLDYPPESTVEFARCQPLYEEIGGWTEDISGAKSYQALPEAVRNYVERIEALLGVKITIVSVGPGREQTVRRG
ncbi:MAG: adenylosuccinate synthase [Methanothrix sp.]|uniref:Adenylosuccinate synthetase n=1 Tax=Methanothrix harundinacea TaxID=301375 RepID=A0A101FRR4_9EURY|nr:MAG: Adenylosuccinate synthetase [Methanothrix harundinacea]MDD3710952.1 adenylosuccinate synthase [Methanothrix sp.]MDI9398489.1 adenylosuccinate synthase [Euryarchaeota archaeon]KUK94089.1 MAG: Adenylosuccinate synthetase [Methanothrix harundinacea]MCP1391745.1 adenylosuccinate synthase [Methanothrix harundinacea]